MSELIFVIIVVYCIVKGSQKKNGQAKQPKAQNTVNTAPKNNSAHNHTYQHKVQPITQASVHQERSQRMQEYQAKQQAQEAKRQEREKELNTSSVDGKINNGYSRGRHPSAKNGDNGSMPNRSEKCIVCGYCGAKNIVPWSTSQKYSCYFCREDI